MITKHPMFSKIKNGILDILFPKMCLGCGREGLYICKDCEVFLSEVPPDKDIVSMWEYEGLMEKLIQKIKYDGCYDIVGELVAMAFKKIDLNLPKDTIITFVPMYKKREKQRGFNQAELIAKKVGEVTGKPVVKLLEKIKDNRSQVGLHPQERAENVKDVFALSSDAKFSSRFTLKGSPATQKIQHARLSNLLLVDDVYTTGATMNECTKVLKKAGVKNVWGFTLSRKMSIQNC